MAIYYEDMEIGKIIPFGKRDVTREEVLAFAQKFDPQPFHLDDEAAAQTFFGRLAASGWHTCALGMAMLVDFFKDTGFRSLGARGIDNLRWLTPVYPGDTLHCTIELLNKAASPRHPHMGFFTSSMKIYNQDEVLVCSFTSNGMVEVRGSEPTNSTPADKD